MKRESFRKGVNTLKKRGISHKSALSKMRYYAARNDRKVKARGDRKLNKPTYTWSNLVGIIVGGIAIFSLSKLTFLGYLFACWGALKRGLLRNNKHMAKMLFSGTILTFSGMMIFRLGLSEAKVGNFLTFLLITIFGFEIWSDGYFRKKWGKIKVKIFT